MKAYQEYFLARREQKLKNHNRIHRKSHTIARSPGAYLNAPVGEKVWFVAGTKMGHRKGMAMVITRALYGLKTSANA